SYDSKINTSKISAEKIQFKSSYKTITKILDDKRRELKFDVNQHGNYFWYTAWLIEPVPPESRINHTSFGKYDRYPYFKNGNWVYEKRHYPGPECNYQEKNNIS
ncbi:hypothetical protein BVX93_02125, partial [bacterium B13(2017)]